MGNECSGCQCDTKSKEHGAMEFDDYNNHG